VRRGPARQLPIARFGVRARALRESLAAPPPGFLAHSQRTTHLAGPSGSASARRSVRRTLGPIARRCGRSREKARSPAKIAGARAGAAGARRAAKTRETAIQVSVALEIRTTSGGRPAIGSSITCWRLWRFTGDRLASRRAGICTSTSTTREGLRIALGQGAADALETAKVIERTGFFVSDGGIAATRPSIRGAAFPRVQKRLPAAMRRRPENRTIGAFLPA